MKTRDEVMVQLGEIIHRHRRRYLEKHSRQCAKNCVYAAINKRGVQGCNRCGSTDPEACKLTALFVPIDTREDLNTFFEQDIRDLKVLQHEYRDIMILLWILNGITGVEVDGQYFEEAEKRRKKWLTEKTSCSDLGKT